MSIKISERVKEEALHIINTKETIREIAKIFNVSKSTVHKDLNDRLSKIDSNLYIEVSNILNEHIKTRHIKGGESTRKKYLKIN